MLTLVFFVSFYVFRGQAIIFAEFNVEFDLFLKMQHLPRRLPPIS
jgi:hypothetical protein